MASAAAIPSGNILFCGGMFVVWEQTIYYCFLMPTNRILLLAALRVWGECQLHWYTGPRTTWCAAAACRHPHEEAAAHVHICPPNSRTTLLQTHWCCSVWHLHEVVRMRDWIVCDIAQSPPISETADVSSFRRMTTFCWDSVFDESELNCDPRCLCLLCVYLPNLVDQCVIFFLRGQNITNPTCYRYIGNSGIVQFLVSIFFRVGLPSPI